ncbi:hypothetical protein BDP55DRAFT_773261 [Colletotrichum godetiae]|uniref:Glucose receptor Git3-like N-terminal domain-containing protein n=1 Tax=Colletotrichum godetiae TaxID=1209918 RepID=A0AAJ0ACQ0_9PEZI|nr:uncharacterized protein BDP55DRAFT_773261 [Colletotrichum godetiae]KAK1658525.1 hypothetical protein BDP55DRAFT_773261 [Colletotrichum godetiae]
MASLAFINWPGYVNNGESCYLPVRPEWTRLALVWVPRYMILLLIVIVYTFIYINVTLRMRRFSRLSTMKRASAAQMLDDGSWSYIPSVPPAPTSRRGSEISMDGLERQRTSSAATTMTTEIELLHSRQRIMWNWPSYGTDDDGHIPVPDEVVSSRTLGPSMSHLSTTSRPISSPPKSYIPHDTVDLSPPDYHYQHQASCDGKPICSQCLRRSINCDYHRAIPQTLLDSIPAGSKIVDKDDALSNADAADLLGILKNVQDEDVLDAIQLLRSGYNAAEVGSTLLRHGAGLSNGALTRATLPPSQTSLEFELMMRHPIPYPAWAPVRPSKLNLQYLGLPRKGCWDGTSVNSTTNPLDGQRYTSFFGKRHRESISGVSSIIASPDLTTLYDNRLLGVDISKWTDLPITNEFSITVLSTYLETDHPIISLFDVDLFLEGLLGNIEFCSPLLVNALFSWACQGYMAKEPEAINFAFKFYEEAKKLWKVEKEAGVDHICTVIAVHYLTMTATSLGAGAEYVDFLGDTLEMAKRLELFNADSSDPPKFMIDNSINCQQVRAQTAWALFNSVTILSMHVHKRLLEFSPRFPIPDTRISLVGRNEQSKENKRRSFHSALFRENCKFFSIVHDMLQVIYGPTQIPYADAISLSFAEATYRRLLSWADGLPLEIAQGEQCTHHVMFLHICYHLAILDLFRSLTRQKYGFRIRLRSFDSQEATPEAVNAASVKQLKRIVLLYHLNYPESSFCLFWHSALLYLANAMLREASFSGNDEEVEFYFRLCITSYRTLYNGFRLAKGIALSLLSMALDKGVLGLQEAKAIRKDLELRGKRHDISDRVMEYFVVDLDFAVTNPSAAQAKKLVQNLERTLIS